MNATNIIYGKNAAMFKFHEFTFCSQECILKNMAKTVSKLGMQSYLGECLGSEDTYSFKSPYLLYSGLAIFISDEFLH